MKPVRLVTLVYSSLALLLISISPIFAQAAEVPLPQPTGAYAVGRTIYEWTDSDRAEIYSDAPDARRELLVAIWYPADASADAAPAPYLPGIWSDVFKQAFGIDTTVVQNHAYADVPVAAAAASYSVLVFQPGNMTVLFTYATLLEEIASHGYVVAAINPTYNAPITIFSDGRMLQAVAEAAQTDQAQLDVWTADALFVVNQLETLNADDARFAGKLDLERLGFFGHSFGGATAANVCHLDERCTAGINLSGAVHNSFTDNAFLIPLMPQLADSIKGAVIDPERAWRITADYTLAFFDKHLNGADVPLAAESPDYAEVRFELNAQ